MIDWIIISLVILGYLYWWYLNIFSLYKWFVIKKRGVLLDAVVVNRSKLGGAGKTLYYKIVYEYNLDGITFKKKDYLHNFKKYCEAKPKSTIKIKHLTNNPSISLIDQDSSFIKDKATQFIIVNVLILIILTTSYFQMK